MRDSLVTIAYIIAGVLFILSLGGLARQETARRGNLYGILGMLIALVATAALSGGRPEVGARCAVAFAVERCHLMAALPAAEATRAATMPNCFALERTSLFSRPSFFEMS